MAENVLSLVKQRQSSHRLRGEGSKVSKNALSLRILKQLVKSSSTREFVKINNPIKSGTSFLRYDCGKLFVRSNANKTVDCYSVQDGGVKRIRKLWSIKAKPRLEDQLIIFDKSLPEYHHGNLVVLRENSQLERYCLKRGKLLEERRIYKDVKFTEITEDLERGWMIIKSIKGSKVPPGFNCTQPILLRLVIWSRLPLEPLYHIQVRKMAGVKDVSLNNGLIFVLADKSKIRLYSVDDVIGRADRVVVSKVDGVLPNVKLNEFGPCLFEVTSHHHHLEIIENFKLFIKSDNEDEFSVGRLGENSSIGQVFVGTDYNQIHDPEVFSFMPDDSGRILKFGTSGLQIYQPPYSSSYPAPGLESAYGNRSCVAHHSMLQQVFDLRSHEESDKNGDKNQRLAGYSRSGRRVALNQYHEMAAESVIASFENELDILGALVTCQIEEDISNAKEVKLIDSRDLAMLRTIPIQLYHSRTSLDMSTEFGLILDLDILVVTVKTGCSITAHIYRLAEILEREEEEEKEKMFPHSKSSFVNLSMLI